jgi:hypothetical protein
VRWRIQCGLLLSSCQGCGVSSSPGSVGIPRHWLGWNSMPFVWFPSLIHCLGHHHRENGLIAWATTSYIFCFFFGSITARWLVME